MFRESEEFYHNLIAQVKDYAIFTTDPRGVITTWNEGCKNVLGYDRDEFVGQHITIVFPPEAVTSGSADKEMEVAAEKGSASDDRWLMRKSGERFWASGITTGVRNEDGNLVGFTKVLRDLTERKQFEERLHQSQMFFRLLAESLPLPQLVWTCRGDGECDYLSPQWVSYTGVPESEQLGYGWLDQLHPDEREQTFAAWKRTINENEVFDVEYRIRRADGAYRWFKTRALPLRSVEGEILKWFGTSTDIDDQKTVEASLRISEERLRAERDFSDKTVDSLPGVFYLFDQQGKFLRWNKNLEEITGYHAEEIVRMSPLDFIPEEDRASVESKFGEVFVRGEANIEVRLMTKGGRSIPYLFRGRRIVIDGRPCLIGNGVDISVIKQAESAAAYLAAIVESSDDAIIGTDLKGNINSWNKGAERLLGYTAAETIGNPVTMLLPPLRMDEEPRILDLLRTGERIDHYETIRRRKDGTDIDVSLTVSPIQNQVGEIIGASKTARDITDRKHAEEEREQFLAREREARAEAEEANRLKDEFLATVSHELRSPLNAILGWARLLSESKLTEERLEHGLEIIERNAQAQARLIEDLLDVSRIVSGKLSIHTRPVILNQTIDGVVASMRPSAEAKGIALRLTESGREISIIGDADRLQQVVRNLLSNAIKFTPDGGRIEVELRRVGAHVELRVSDTGRGISPEFLPHVFDRFRQAYRTDAGARAGLGLGLTIVRYIVEAHGGSVTTESLGVGQGATFTVILPMAPASPTPVPAIERHHFRLKAGALPSLSGVRVLVVDDDEDARDVLSAVLGNYGAEVMTAVSAAQALDILATEKWDVLVSDINMPGMDGYELIRRVRAMKPEKGGRIPAVALTAYARAEDRVQALQAGYQTHVPKPIEPAELEVVVATLAKNFNRGA
ncbi:MAG TPA: PAS domain S-box protein [Blastocatellia bacterium]|nr:PAS domain S-box protein [Blastocatellia bacterium]